MTDPDALFRALAEIKAELVAHGLKIEQLTLQVTKQNSRIGKTEDFIQSTKIEAAHQSGMAEGKAALRKRDIAYLAGAWTVLVTLVQIGLKFLA